MPERIVAQLKTFDPGTASGTFMSRKADKYWVKASSADEVGGACRKSARTPEAGSLNDEG